MTRSLPWRLIAGWAALAGFLVVVAVSTIAISYLLLQVDGLSRNLTATQNQVKSLGEQPVSPPAPSVRANPDATPSPLPAAGPSDQQVYAAVAVYFRAHPVQPGRPPTGAEIAQAVANYLAAHPAPAGPPGVTPTPQQVADAVRAYLTENPPPAGPSGPTGPKGEQGEPGRAPTAEEIAAAVQTYMTANPPPYCPAGTEPKEATVLTATGPVDAVICVSTAK